MSDKKLSVFRCPRCHEQVEGSYIPRGHYCATTFVEGEGCHFVPAEEVEVIPVADVQKVEAALDSEVKVAWRACERLWATEETLRQIAADTENGPNELGELAQKCLDRLSDWASKEER